MKNLLLLTVFVLSLFASNAQTESHGTTITVTIPVPGHGGSLIAGLYNEATFMKSAPIQGQESDINEGYASVTFTNVMPGSHAITLFHDKNGNKTMDFEPNGMPKEMYGVSNNPMSYGPPQWKDAKFEVGTEPITMQIRL
ncbi:MAG: DUF2141 domain-containing protein [Flavobacteriaceae bacterium]